MQLSEFLKTIPLPAFFILAAVLIIITLFMTVQYARMKGLDGMRKDVYQLILQAEHKYRESGQGQQKLMWVVRQARGLMPAWIRTFVSEKVLMNMIEKWFQGIKDLLDDGKVNDSRESQ